MSAMSEEAKERNSPEEPVGNEPVNDILLQEETDDPGSVSAVPPVLALPRVKFEDHLRTTDACELFLHTVTVDQSQTDQQQEQQKCCWYFMLQADSPMAKRIATTAILNEKGGCSLFRGCDQQTLPVRLDFAVPITDTDRRICALTDEDNNLIAEIDRIDGDTWSVEGRRRYGTLAGRKSLTWRPLPCQKSDCASESYQFVVEDVQVAVIIRHVYKDRLREKSPFVTVNEIIDRELLRIIFNKDTVAEARNLCTALALAIGCRDALLYYNPVSTK